MSKRVNEGEIRSYNIRQEYNSEIRKVKVPVKTGVMLARFADSVVVEIHKTVYAIDHEPERVECKQLVKDGKWLVPESERPIGWERLELWEGGKDAYDPSEAKRNRSGQYFDRQRKA